jgi:hypothetical protein
MCLCGKKKLLENNPLNPGHLCAVVFQIILESEKPDKY